MIILTWASLSYFQMIMGTCGKICQIRTFIYMRMLTFSHLSSLGNLREILESDAVRAHPGYKFREVYLFCAKKGAAVKYLLSNLPVEDSLHLPDLPFSQNHVLIAVPGHDD